jgi:uncharacterized membrane protein
MAVISKSVAIKAPVGRVFDFVTSPENWTRYVTSLVEVKDLSADSPAMDSTFRWAYKMMGLKFTGKGTVTEYARNKRFGLSLKSKVRIDEHYEFESKGDGVTELKVRVEYEMPGEILTFIANNKLVERLNNLEARNILDKIKVMCEAGA